MSKYEFDLQPFLIKRGLDKKSLKTIDSFAKLFMETEDKSILITLLERMILDTKDHEKNT